MLNKSYKIIHNKYSKFFEFLFFLRYLLIIFVISTALFLSIPIFFNYEKKAEDIKSHLFKNYGLKINNYKKIKYNVFPLPNLELTNTQIELKSTIENLSVKKIKIFPDFLSIYNYENFNSNKIVLKNSYLKLQISDLKLSMKELFYKKNNFLFDNLKIIVMNQTFPIVTLENINFANFGARQNLIKGMVFDKNFKIDIDENFKKINFKLINSGIDININFDKNKKNNISQGTFKSKILNTNFKSSFEYDGKKIKIHNSHLRSKNISLKNDSTIILNPFLDINSNIVIEDFNHRILKKIDLFEILRFKDLLRKINFKNEINFNFKKFNKKFFDNLYLKIDLAHARINYSKNLLTSNHTASCEGSLNLLEEYPLLFFDCYLKSSNKKELFKKFSIKRGFNDEIFEMRINGNLSILKKKVNFKNISMNSNYVASKEDLKYFKDIFERILFDESFLEIFNFKKIKEFIKEIN